MTCLDQHLRNCKDSWSTWRFSVQVQVKIQKEKDQNKTVWFTPEREDEYKPHKLITIEINLIQLATIFQEIEVVKLITNLAMEQNKIYN